MDRRLDFDLRKAYSARKTTAKQVVDHVENCDLCSKKQMVKCAVGVSVIEEYCIADRRYHELKIKEISHERAR